MSVEQLELFFTSKNYEQFITELKKFRHRFIDELYPNIVHDIVRQIDDCERYYVEGNYQLLDLVIKNLLGIETGKYQMIGRKNVISLKNATLY